MPEESFEERTEAPSPKRRQEAREKGNVAKSTEINSVLVLLMGLLTLRILGPWIFEQIVGSTIKSFHMISQDTFSQMSLISYFRESVIIFFKLSLPVSLLILFIGISANILQIGFLLTFHPIIPSLEKINPLSGLKRMFSMRSLVEAVKSILKMTIIGVVAYLTVKGEFINMLKLCNASVGAIWLFILNVGFTIVFRIALVLIVLALLDLLYQRYEHEKKLKMTRQEVKEERKQMEGDPQVKARIRSLQREMARRRMMEEVPKATVVVTNPTTLAIAIRYEPSEMETPVVIAKGKLLIAEKIKEIALKENIPVVEDKPLARAMFDQVEPGDKIPMEFYNAVAEILAYVYRLKNKTAAYN
ncbi:MAG: flagellar biosynthesis protein FlhB [Chitinispirillia bacterium]